MLFATILSFGWPLLAVAGLTSAVFAPFRNHVEMSTRNVTFNVPPSCTLTAGTRVDSWLWSTSDTNVKSLRLPAWLYVPVTRMEIVAKSGCAAMNAASSLEPGLWIWNSSWSYRPGGALTVTCGAIAVPPRGSDTSVAAVSNSSQSPFPATASHVGTSARLSSTCLSTSWAERTITVSLPTAITVLSPPAATLDPTTDAESPAAGAGAAAVRDVSAKLSDPIVLLEQAASPITGNSAKSFTIFIFPPSMLMNAKAETALHIWASDVPGSGSRTRRKPSTLRERSHISVCIESTQGRFVVSQPLRS